MKKLIALFSIFAFNAMAQMPDAVLFKVSDIKPIKNEENTTVACEYNLTVYNRSNADLNNVALSMAWSDTTVARTIEAEKKASSRSKSIFTKGSSRTQSLDSDTVTASAVLGDIPAKKQIMTKQKVESNKCFLLLNKANFVVESCQFAETDKNAEAAIKCSDSFIYIDAENPEYYTKFSDENYDAKKLKQESIIKKELLEINEKYNQNVEEINRLNQTIESF